MGLSYLSDNSFGKLIWMANSHMKGEYTGVITHSHLCSHGWRVENYHKKPLKHGKAGCIVKHQFSSSTSKAQESVCAWNSVLL